MSRNSAAAATVPGDFDHALCFGPAVIRAGGPRRRPCRGHLGFAVRRCFEADSADAVEQVCRCAGMAPQQLNPAVEGRVRGTYHRDDSAPSGND